MNRASELVPDSQNASRGHLRVGYLSWRYPVLSATFVVLEVEALRARGVHIETMAIRPGLPQDVALGPELAAETWTILPVSALAVLRGHVRGLARGPGAYFGVLRAAMSAGLHGGLGGLRRQIMYFGEAVLLAERLRARDLNHLHVHFGDAAGEVGRLTALLETRRPRREPLTWSITIHGPGELQYPSRYLVAEKLRDADDVFAVSELARAQMISLVEGEPDTWKKIHVVHCGLDLSEWSGVRSRPDSTRPVRILTVGRLALHKSHHVLIEAAAILRDRGVNFRISIAGEGPEREHLEARIRELDLGGYVTLLGAVDRATVRALLDSHDVFCLASIAEGLPVVLMEAMASCVPVVTTRLLGVGDLIEDGVSGLLVPSARPDLLAESLERLCADPELGARLAAAGYASVVAGFDIKSSVEQLEGYWRQARARIERSRRA